MLSIGDVQIAVVGAKGFGGGFAGRCATEFGEDEMKRFVAHTRSVAADMQRVMEETTANVRIVLYHYSPIADTLMGEPLEIYPFLGSYLLGGGGRSRRRRGAGAARPRTRRHRARQDPWRNAGSQRRATGHPALVPRVRHPRPRRLVPSAVGVRGRVATLIRWTSARLDSGWAVRAGATTSGRIASIRSDSPPGNGSAGTRVGSTPSRSTRRTTGPPRRRP